MNHNNIVLIYRKHRDGGGEFVEHTTACPTRRIRLPSTARARQVHGQVRSDRRVERTRPGAASRVVTTRNRTGGTHVTPARVFRRPLAGTLANPFRTHERACVCVPSSAPGHDVAHSHVLLLCARLVFDAVVSTWETKHGKQAFRPRRKIKNEISSRTHCPRPTHTNMVTGRLVVPQSHERYAISIGQKTRSSPPRYL